MASLQGVVEVITKLNNLNFVDKKTQWEKLGARGKHRKFCLDGSVATLNIRLSEKKGPMIARYY